MARDQRTEEPPKTHRSIHSHFSPTPLLCLSLNPDSLDIVVHEQHPRERLIRVQQLRQKVLLLGELQGRLVPLLRRLTTLSRSRVMPHRIRFRKHIRGISFTGRMALARWIALPRTFLISSLPRPVGASGGPRHLGTYELLRRATFLIKFLQRPMSGKTKDLGGETQTRMISFSVRSSGLAYVKASESNCAFPCANLHSCKSLRKSSSGGITRCLDAEFLGRVGVG